MAIEEEGLFKILHSKLDWKVKILSNTWIFWGSKSRYYNGSKAVWLIKGILLKSFPQFWEW